MLLIIPPNKLTGMKADIHGLVCVARLTDTEKLERVLRNPRKALRLAQRLLNNQLTVAPGYILNAVTADTDQVVMVLLISKLIVSVPMA